VLLGFTVLLGWKLGYACDPSRAFIFLTVSAMDYTAALKACIPLEEQG
jgi:hypothetical protein